MSKKIKIKPKLNKSANSDWEIVDDVSMKGYSDNSPYRDRKSIDIHSPNGLIDMSETGMPILANGKFLPPYSGMHQFEPGVVREERIMQNGGNFKNYNWKENREYKNNPANLNSSGGLDVGVSKNLPLGLNSSVGVGFDEDKVNYRAGLGYNNNGLRVNTDYNSSGRLNASVNYNSPIGLNAGFRYSDNKGEETYSGNVGYRGEKIPVGLNAEYIHTPKGHNANANLNFNTKNINGNFGYEYNQGGNNHSFNTGVNIPFLGGMGDIGINSKYNIGNKQPSVNVGGIFKFQDGGSIPIMQTGGRAPIQTENEWEILEEAQNGVKIKPKYEWSTQEAPKPKGTGIKTTENVNTTKSEPNKEKFIQDKINELKSDPIIKKLSKKYGEPNINPYNSTLNVGNAPGFYNPLNNTINLNINKNLGHYQEFFNKDSQSYQEHYNNLKYDMINTYLKELPHSVQKQKYGTVGFINNFLNKDLYNHVKSKITKTYDDSPYSIPGTIEHEAHEIIQPKIEQEWVDEYENLKNFKSGGSIPIMQNGGVTIKTGTPKRNPETNIFEQESFKMFPKKEPLPLMRDEEEFVNQAKKTDFKFDLWYPNMLSLEQHEKTSSMPFTFNGQTIFSKDPKKEALESYKNRHKENEEFMSRQLEDMDYYNRQLNWHKNNLKNPMYLKRLENEFKEDASKNLSKRKERLTTSNIYLGTAQNRRSLTEERNLHPNVQKEYDTIFETFTNEYGELDLKDTHLVPTGKRKMTLADIKYMKEFVKDADKIIPTLAIHEGQHLITDADDGMSDLAKQIYKEAYIPSGNNKDDEYFGRPTELDARKKALDFDMEKFGIKKYEEKFTPKHHKELLKIKKKLSSDSNEFLDKIKPESIQKIFNTIAYGKLQEQTPTAQNGGSINKFQDGGNTKLTKEEVLRAVQQAEEANRSNKYEPTQIVNKSLQNVKNKYDDQAYEFTDNHYPVNQFEENGHNDYVDALRHAGTAMYMTAGQGKWAAPFKIPYTNIMGVAHEIKGLGDYLSNTKSKTWEGTKQQFKETGSDLYNNFIGSIIGGLPTDIENKEKVLGVAKDYGVLSDLSKKKNGGSAPMTKNGSTINKFKDGGKTSQWEILPEAEEGKKISLEDFKPRNPNSNERIQQEIVNKDALNRVTKGSKENPVNLEEITVSAPRNRNPVTAQAAATRWKEENPELQGSSADLASAMFLAPVGEFSHTPSRVLNYGVGAYKNQDLRFNPYKSELSETLGLETNPNDAFHSVRNFFVDNAADFAAPSIIKSFGKGLNKSINYVDDINSINKELKFIRENGLSKGLSEKQIKSLQMEKVGITDNQRKAFTPVLSDAFSKYVKPISYEEGVISKLKDIPKNIKQGGWKNDPYFKDYAHTGKREDAWNLYLGKPQKNNTFRYSETVPKSMYYPELKNNLDVYNLNYEDDLADFVKYMDKSKTSKYSDLVSGNTIYPSDAGVMGGYNLTRVDGNFPNIGKGIVEYNDIWDLHPKTTMRSLFPKPIANNTWLNDNVFYKKNPNGSLTPREIELKMENFIGKPFMSHGRVPVEFESLPNAFKTYSDKEQKLIDFMKMAKGYKFKSGGKVNTDWEIIQD